MPQTALWSEVPSPSMKRPWLMVSSSIAAKAVSTGLRVPAEIEEAGIDELAHGEMAYALEEEDRLAVSASA